VRIRVEDLDANLIGSCRKVVVDPSSNVLEVSPCDEAVDKAVAPMVRGVFSGEAKPVEVVRIVRKVEITRDVSAADGACLGWVRLQDHGLFHN
jgi:hypothetical protein